MKIREDSDEARRDAVAQTRYMDKQKVGEMFFGGGTRLSSNDTESTSPNKDISTEELRRDIIK